MNLLCSILAAIVVGTWNGDWFPSGRAEHRANAAVEDATITAVAKMLRHGLDAVDPAATNDVVLCLNEIRGPRVASNLVARIGRTNLTVAVITGYRRRDRFDQQQDVIATTLPVVSAGWQKFRNHGKETPPRGYAYANLVFANATTGVVYATHLKSNYGAGKNKDAQALNRAKRTHAVEQILACANDAKLVKGGPVIVGGDMNADRWKAEFKSEKIFALFDAAGFLDLLGLLPPNGRGTHPSAKWGDSALDYVFTRGFRSVATPRIVPSEALSDHNAFFALVELEPDR
jgi:endonuclease/exonuclease/phosphatase family metal-dependent hydrolase